MKATFVATVFASLVTYASAQCQCGGAYFSSSQVNAAIGKARSGGAGSYPHQYNNYENIYFDNGPTWQEYPVLTSGGTYNGGSPGAHRVVYKTSNGQFSGCITHEGASGNAFVACDW